jgi:hypothetical protein
MKFVCATAYLLLLVFFSFLPSFLLPRGNNTKKTILLSSHMHVAPFGGVFCCVRNGSGRLCVVEEHGRAPLLDENILAHDLSWRAHVVPGTWVGPMHREQISDCGCQWPFAP